MDIASMCHSLETRSPFLDHSLAEFVARLPSRMKVKGMRKKHILRRALRGTVPAENLDRPKRGFAVPIGAWLRGELKDFAADHLLDSRARQRGLLDGSVVEAMAQAHFSGRADYAHHLWTLLMLELWHRTWVDA
jgi:asparagine synthase (glutamine-hydrolysing)